mmetsp:Transcript_75282/g.218621  ORF Transcript_75282/g.218621 Transcript_75282/m.218621 type:complete len:260 (+) Transcript_75282:1812-2591(+)
MLLILQADLPACFDQQERIFQGGGDEERGVRFHLLRRQVPRLAPIQHAEPRVLRDEQVAGMRVAIEDAGLREGEGEELDEVVDHADLLAPPRALRKVAQPLSIDVLHREDPRRHQVGEDRRDDDVHPVSERCLPRSLLAFGFVAEVQFDLGEARHLADNVGEVIEKHRRHVGQQGREQRRGPHVDGEVSAHLPVLHLDNSLDLLHGPSRPGHIERRPVDLGDGRAAERRPGVQADLLPPILAELLGEGLLHVGKRLRRH